VVEHPVIERLQAYANILRHALQRSKPFKDRRPERNILN
jgi:hypothetical protein